MSNVDKSSCEFFEEKYRTADDPWSFATSPYEQRRYSTIIEHVAAGQCAQVFEPGCSIGELTVQLAQCCSQVTAIDIAETAIAVASAKSPAPHLDAQVGALAELGWSVAAFLDVAGHGIDQYSGETSEAMQRARMLQLYVRQHHGERDLEAIGIEARRTS